MARRVRAGGLLPVATYSMNPWVLALTLPAGSSQGPLPKQITGINLREVCFWEMHHMEVALLVVRGSQGSPGWSLQPGLFSPLQKLCTLSVWSTSRRRARLLVCGHWHLPWWPPFLVQLWPAALCSVSQTCSVSPTMDRDTFLGKIHLGSQRLCAHHGWSCLLWFGLCCADVYPARPVVWHRGTSTDVW